MNNNLRRIGLARGHWNWCAALLLMLTIASAAFAKDLAPKAESRFAKLDGARVHYVNYGKGHDALVLVHGLTTNAVPALEIDAPDPGIN